MKRKEPVFPEAYNRQLTRSMLLALLMAVLTVFFCVYVADGIFGIRGLKHREVIGQASWGPVTESWVERENQTGAVIFWIFLIGLPLLFSRWIKWRHTLMNYLLYPLMWYVVDACVESHHAHFFLHQGTGWFGIERIVNPISMTLFFFVAHSVIFAVRYAVRTTVKKMKST